MPRKKPAAETPVNIKNLLRIFLISPFIVKNTNIIPNKEKIMGGNKKIIEPLNVSLIDGKKN